MIGIFSKLTGAAILVSLAACTSPGAAGQNPGQPLALASPEGAWSGILQATTPACPGGQHAQMHVGSDGHFAIDPFGSTLIVDGHQDADGHFRGVLHHLDASGHRLSLRFNGVGIAGSDGGTIIGTLSTGPCHWSVSLHRS